jgi:hypothetical protein
VAFGEEELLPWEEPPERHPTLPPAPRIANRRAFVRPAQRLTDPALFGFAFSTRSELAVAHGSSGAACGGRHSSRFA